MIRGKQYKYKRLVDLLLLLPAFILGLPLMLIILTILLFIQGRNIFFCQIRPGYLEKPFRLIKFRTMKNISDTDGHLLSDDKRITKFGKFLRKTSLDELPELFNVLKGEMSLVGPRPLLMEYLEIYNSAQARRHEVQPGLTGWAQINGRNELCWQKKFEMDVWYVDNISFFLDMKILWLTFWKVLKREGISQVGYATTNKFTGNN